MNSSQFSANNWPGPWNPVSLPNRKYYRLRSTKPRTPSSEDAESSLLAIGTREVDEIKQADFIVVDDDIQPNDGAYASLLTYAERNHIAIVTVADIKQHCQRFAVKNQAQSKSQYKRIGLTDNLVLYSARKSLNTARITRIGQKLYSTRFFSAIPLFVNLSDIRGEFFGSNRKSQQTVLKIDSSTYMLSHCPLLDSADLEAIVVPKPPRIIGTRWTLEDVRTDYVVEAWTPVGDREWRYQWDIVEFNEIFMGSDEFTPEEAVRAALWEFFIENKDDVESLIW